MVAITLPKMNRLLACLLLLLLLAACTDPREGAIKRLQKVGREKLRRDAALIYKDTFSARGLEYVVIRPRRWPQSFQAFSPVRVGAYPDGISLALLVRSKSEAGLYVVPQSMDHVPGGIRGGRFEKVAEGIYWYEFGE